MYDIQDTIQIKDVINLIKTKEYVIYGNGFIGKRFIKQIERMNCKNQISSVVVTNLEENSNSRKDGLKSIYEISKNSFVFIAAHESVATEMRKVLESIGVSNYVWIYPYLIELELGAPIERNRKVTIKDLIDNLSKSYAAAIYYLTIKEYCRDHIYDGSLYIKMTSHYTTGDTAKKRWEIFRRKIEECQEKGFCQDCNIKVFENNNLIDGMHRLTLAKYFGEKYLYADVYRGNGSFYSIEGIGGNVFIQEEDLPRYYKQKEIEMIREIENELKNT
ncbi:hypothetical protein SAMN05216582_11311 [Selenomonas ruminantium]|uniref:Uncharacterized protein n=1 Tax=Selenomonas ruminantium TaxID=971 RepID=A0A1M6UKI6_SELRU|nr:hypothetical protein [Selenomonas ruminantium]SHK69754.1 hypothetical protein SAMN05216582_11311 [Selenomonas ruminantium]